MSKLYQFVLLKLIIFLFFSQLLLASNELKLGVIGSFNNFNPYSIIGIAPKDYYYLSYDSLMVKELNDLSNFKPLLADKYKIDGNDIIFYLNKKSPISVDDIIFTFKTIKQFGIPYYKEKLLEVNDIVKIKEGVVKFSAIKYSQSLFDLIVSLPIISKEYWEGKNFISPSLDIPKTSGAYFIENYKQGKEIVFKKNPNYWAKNIPSRKGYFNFDTISYKYVKSSNQLSELYSKGDINFKERTKLDKLGKNDKIFIKKNKDIPTFKAYFLNINDIQLRKAIYYAYNFALVKEYFLNDNQERLQSLFENTPFKDTSFTFNDVADLKKSKEILKARKDIKVRFLFRSTEDFKISQDFINNLKSLGIEVTYKIPSFYDYIEMRKKKEYEIVLEELLFSSPPADELISYFTSGGEYNYSNVDEKDLINKKDLKGLDLKLKKDYIYIPLYYNLTTEYIYKNNLDFKHQETLDIFKWWSK